MFKTALLSMVLLAGCADYETGAIDGGDGNDGGDDTVQGEVTFGIANQSADWVYVYWGDLGQSLVQGEQKNEDGWTYVPFAPPGCKLECNQQTKDQDCCILCEQPFPAVRRIAPGDEIEWVWNGKFYPLVEDHCSNCSCYRQYDASRGIYRANVDVWTTYSCMIEPCGEPDENGVIGGAYPQGDSTTGSTEFEVIYAGDRLEIVIE
jgi:hypothetical protein